MSSHRQLVNRARKEARKDSTGEQSIVESILNIPTVDFNPYKLVHLTGSITFLCKNWAYISMFQIVSPFPSYRSRIHVFKCFSYFIIFMIIFNFTDAKECKLMVGDAYTVL